MGDTSIEWTRGSDGSAGKTWNPVRGCSIASAGCHKCYAMRVAARFSGEGQPYEGLAKFSLKKRVAQWTGKVRVVPEHLADPLRWTKPRKIFVNSMSDAFHDGLSNEDIAAVFGVMAAAPHHVFQVLTKRARRMREWFDWVVPHQHGPLLDFADAALAKTGLTSLQRANLLRRSDGWRWPLPNVWLGVSAEDQPNWDERTEHLRQTPAAVRFVSIEPQLGPIDCKLTRGDAISWIIVGGESGYDARPFHVEWARSIVKQCAAAKVAAFVKQLGAHVRTDGMQSAGDWPDQTPLVEDGDGGFRKTLKSKKGNDPREWPPSLRVRQFPATPSP